MVTAARDDDKDKSYLEKYIAAVLENAKSDLFIPNLIPLVKDVVSIFKGYDVERADMSLVRDLYSAIKSLSSDKKTLDEKLSALAGSVAAFFGLPVKNVLRDINSVKNMYDNFFVNKNKTDLTGIKYSIADSLGLGGSASSMYADLAKAAENDNEKEYQKIYQHLIETGKDETDINTGLRNHYKESKEVQKQTKDYIGKLSGNRTFEGFSPEDKKKVESNIKTALATEAKVKATEREPDEYDILYTAYRTNKTKYNALMQKMLDEGKTKKQIEDGLEIAKYAYMKSVGIDLHEYLMYKMATSKKYADKDNSGGISKAEKRAVVNDIDLDSKTKSAIKNYQP